MTTLDQAIHKLDQGKLKEGQRILDALLKNEPDDPAVLYDLGMRYSEQGIRDASIDSVALRRLGPRLRCEADPKLEPATTGRASHPGFDHQVVPLLVDEFILARECEG